MLLSKHICSKFVNALISFMVIVGLPRLTQSYAPENIPNPLEYPDECGRNGVPRSNICDIDNFLSKEIKDKIEGHINGITNAEVAVIIVPKMSSSFIDGNTKGQAAKRFATQLHATWGVGDSSKHDGILLFLTIHDRQVYISTGIGVQDRLSSTMIDLIINHMGPNLRAKEYGIAVEIAILDIERLLSGQSLLSSSPSASGLTDISIPHSTGSDSSSKSPKNCNRGKGCRRDLTFTDICTFGTVYGGIVIYSIWDNRRHNAEMRRIRDGEDALKAFIGNLSVTHTNCPACGFTIPVPMLPSSSSSAKVDSQNLLDQPPLLMTSAVKIDVDTTAKEVQNEVISCPYCQYSINNANPSSSIGNLGQDDPKSDKFWPLLGRHRNGFRFGFGSIGRSGSYVGFSTSPPSLNVPPHSAPAIDTGSIYSSSPISHHDIPSIFYGNNAMNDGNTRARALLELDQMAIKHPDVLTADTYAKMTEVVRTGSLQDVQQVAQTRLTEVSSTINEKEKAWKNGSGGAKRRRFGGGRSFGGGGGGW